MNFKKINFKQPKYILPLVLVPTAAFIVWQFSGIFTGKGNDNKDIVATDSFNTNLPNAVVDDKQRSKMELMQGRYGKEHGAYTAVNGWGGEDATYDSVDSGYSEAEKDRIDRENAEAERQRKAQEELERSLRESSRHVNNYAGRHAAASTVSRSRTEEVDDYAREIAEIQRRSLAAQRAIDAGTGDADDADTPPKSSNKDSESSRKAEKKEQEEKTEVVRKADTGNADSFHTVSTQQLADNTLIKAMIDRTTKAREGTRLRFKLLDDVTISDVKLKKGTYLYGLVSGFGQQRVKADITSILVGNKFLKVHLSVYDNDGMEGFYVPESMFRDLIRDAGSQAAGTNIQFNNDYGGSELTGETIALQALQNIYQSTSNAVSGNMRKNKAKIKYNTIVYLINTSSNSQNQ